MVRLWRSEDNLQKLVFTYHSVVAKGQTWVVRPSSKHSDPQNHPTSSEQYFLYGS